jgi:hypothetical protein
MFVLSGFGTRTFAIFALMLLAVMCSAAQCTSPTAAGVLPNLPAPKPKPAEPVLPEAGFLSDTHYTSQYFGFSFDLPLTVRGHEIMLPLMPDKQHALLALQFEQGQEKGSIMVTADDPAPGYNVNIPEERQKDLDEWSKNGTQAGGLPLTPIPDFMLRTHRFYHRVTHRGHNYAAQYWAGINNYTVKVVVATNDEDFLKKAKDVMADVKFYCPQDDGTLAADDGKPVKVPGAPYAGPTVPTSRVNAALKDEPGKQIPPGEFADGVYQNADLGFRYELPQGWKPLAASAIDPPLEATALREYQFLHACSRILLQASPEQPRAGENVSSAIILRALDPNCLAMRTAASVTDKRAADEVAASFEDLGEFGEIGSDGLMSIAGHLFMVFHGTIATSARGADLSQRLSQVIFATRYNKLLLVWSAMAATTTGLQQLPTGTVVFGDSPSIQLSSADPAPKKSNR